MSSLCCLSTVLSLRRPDPGRETACVTIRVQSFYPAVSWPSQTELRLAGSRTTPWNGARKKERERECRAGKTDASSVAQIWQGLVRQLSVQIQTQDLVGWVRVCACVCACCDMLLPRPQGSDKEIQSAQLHGASGGRLSHSLLPYRSVLSLARQGQAAAQHGSQSDA